MDVRHLPYSGNNAMFGGSVSLRQLLCLLALRSCGGAQPHRHMGGLHGLPYYTHQIIAQRVKVGLVTQLGGEGFQGLPRVVLPAIEPAVHEPLHPATQRDKQCVL
jgi:hypothetical protein